MGGKQTKLKTEVVDELVRSTPFNEHEIHSWYRGFLKDCPGGQLNIDDFQRLYCALFNNSSAPTVGSSCDSGESYSCGDPRPFARFVFRAFDHNGDGLIEFRDILTTFSVMGTAASNDDKNGDGEAKRLRWAFRIYDLDGDGYISREEMLQVLKAIYKMIGPLGVFKAMGPDESTPEQRTVHLFKLLDLDGDDRISLEDFCTGVRSDPEVMRMIRSPPYGLKSTEAVAKPSNHKIQQTPPLPPFEGEKTER